MLFSKTKYLYEFYFASSKGYFIPHVVRTLVKIWQVLSIRSIVNYNPCRKVIKKIAQKIIENPGQIVNCTISELANLAKVSGASVTRFCHNLGLAGFHDLKIQLVQVAGNEKKPFFAKYC